MSPELVNGKECHGPAIDVWALGVILYVMIAGIFPFRARSSSDLFRKIEKGAFATPPWVSETAMALISKMLEIDSKKRASVEDLERDAWVRPNNSNKILIPV